MVLKVPIATKYTSVAKTEEPDRHIIPPKRDEMTGSSGPAAKASGPS